MKDVVKLETAKKLKELGFDKTCLFIWYEHDTKLQNILPKNNSKRKQVKRLLGTSNNIAYRGESDKNLDMSDTISYGEYTVTTTRKYWAPYYEDIVRWLKEIWNIEVDKTCLNTLQETVDNIIQNL